MRIEHRISRSNLGETTESYAAAFARALADELRDEFPDAEISVSLTGDSEKTIVTGDDVGDDQPIIERVDIAANVVWERADFADDEEEDAAEIDSLEICFDNAGNIIVETIDYAHLYQDPAQAAGDYKLLADGGNTSHWDGHSDDDRIGRHYEQCRYYDHDDIQTIIQSGEHDCSGYAEAAFFRALGVAVNGED